MVLTDLGPGPHLGAESSLPRPWDLQLSATDGRVGHG